MEFAVLAALLCGAADLVAEVGEVVDAVAGAAGGGWPAGGGPGCSGTCAVEHTISKGPISMETPVIVADYIIDLDSQELQSERSAKRYCLNTRINISPLCAGSLQGDGSHSL